ncbi:sensor histidine kinase [Campylobacter corcagiensis]|uniref:histidine kinase n=1 Tax=Campylobacter corcagiensis TaxID=1448857 RepID=A0A7M1LDE2_9BACT|nr:HAMP domain-containing sensor histidine kinase [Campylobacter corcagiensis]QKF65295.1 PAS sensor-containing two-component system histidine kinase [Campylobacter corcagiensis]QOQ86572.1 PAS domain S-box protein [Campylobacter corcagiensis]
MDRSQSRLKQYQDAIDASNIVSKTDINGTITFVNDEFCNISKYTRDELLGQPHNIVRHPDVSPKVFENLWSTILSKKVYKGIVKNRAKDGSTFYLNATIIPILDESGDIEEFVALRYDITEVISLNERLTQTKNELKELNLSLEKKVAEQTRELKELNSGLEARVAEEIAKNEEKNRLLAQQAKLASMGEMIGNIAHQWRQPLSELSIDLFKMKQSAKDEDKFLEIYEHAKILIKNMSNTIDDFRNFFRSDKEKNYFNVKEVAEETIAMLKSTIQKERIDLDLDIDDDLKIYGIKSEFFQVLMNLITNAKDAMSDLDEKWIKISAKQDLSYVYFSVCNKGNAISSKILDKIFEPYFTTKHKSSGTGLGLYICKMIIENLKGSIVAKNFEDGVKFDITIPKKEKE